MAENNTYIVIAIEGTLNLKPSVPNDNIAWYENHDEANLKQHSLIIQAGYRDKVILKYYHENTEDILTAEISVVESDKEYLLKLIANIWNNPMVEHHYSFSDFEEFIEGVPLTFKYVETDSMESDVILEEYKKIIPGKYENLRGYIGYSDGLLRKFNEINNINWFDFDNGVLWETVCKQEDGIRTAWIVCDEIDPYIGSSTFEFGIWYR
jgi:hypothetical protein